MCTCVCARRCVANCDVLWILCFFFFQAEDGIRDLVRSRGLGDVYKRQVGEVSGRSQSLHAIITDAKQTIDRFAAQLRADGPVSYTHLTLPTSDLV